MRITELRVQGLRTLANIRLPLDGLTVLIGENGSGKSSILEACEILRRVPSDSFLHDLHAIHGGMAALLRNGAQRIKLGVNVQGGNGSQYAYDLTLGMQGGFGVLEEEDLHALRDDDPTRISRQGRAQQWVKGNGERLQIIRLDTERSMLCQWSGGPPDAYYAVLGALRGIRVHLPFELLPAWAARALDRKSALRSSVLFAPATELERLGLNLANAFHALKNNHGHDAWQRTLDYIRLGLGQHVEDVITWADPGGGNIGLGLKHRGSDRPIMAAQLSDGTLAYLAFVALFRLAQAQGGPSLLAFDEPDLHLHPQLLSRVLDMFEQLAADRPVLLATHSDRLLDALSDPARSVVLCELDQDLATRLVRPDAQALQGWLERYRGLGDLRSEGYESAVMTEPVEAA